MRELIFLWEEQDQKWAKPMIDHLLTIKTGVDTARDAGLAALPAEDLDRFHKRYLRIVEAGYAQNPVTESSAGPKRRGCRIRGYVSTARKNGINALDALRRVFLGDPLLPAVNTS